MKIFGPDPNVNQNKKIEDLRRSGKQAPEKAAKSGGSRGGVSETVALSGQARDVAKAGERVRVSPDVRKEKVEAVREKIERGEYHVSGDQIAGKIIEDIIKGGA